MRTDGSPDPRQPPELTCALYRWGAQEAEDNTFQLAQTRDIEIQPVGFSGSLERCFIYTWSKQSTARG